MDVLLRKYGHNLAKNDTFLDLQGEIFMDQKVGSSG